MRLIVDAKRGRAQHVAEGIDGERVGVREFTGQGPWGLRHKLCLDGEGLVHAAASLF